MLFLPVTNINTGYKGMTEYYVMNMKNKLILGYNFAKMSLTPYMFVSIYVHMYAYSNPSYMIGRSYMKTV